MKTTTKRFKAILLLLLCVTLAFPRIDSSAKSAQYYQAMKAYKTWLGRNTVCVIKRGRSYYDINAFRKKTYSTSRASDVKFALAYIDNDGIPELIISTKLNSNCTLYGILTFKNGKIYRVFDADGWDRFGGYYYRTGYFLNNSISEGIPINRDYMLLSKTSVRRVFYKFDCSYRMKSLADSDSYSINGKDVSKSTFYSRLKTATKGKSITFPKVYQNTAANRNRILK